MKRKRDEILFYVEQCAQMGQEVVLLHTHLWVLLLSLHHPAGGRAVPVLLLCILVG